MTWKTPSAAFAAACAALTTAPITAVTALAAQTAPIGAGWHEVARGEDGTTVSVDSASVSRIGDSTFVVHTGTRFASPVRLEIGADVDREVDLEELDCGKGRSRGMASQLFNGERNVLLVPLAGDWADVPDNRRAIFDASCAWLVGSFLTLPRDYALEVADEGPELVNRTAVAASLSREYPPMMRETGQGGNAVLFFRILANGTVDRPSIEVVANSRPEFAEAARRVVLTMRFRPARVARAAVPSWISLPVTFSIQDERNSFVFPEAGREGRPEAPEVPPSMRRPE